MGAVRSGFQWSLAAAAGARAETVDEPRGDLADISVVPSSWKLNLRAGIARVDSWQASLYGRDLSTDRTARVTGLAGVAATCTFIETGAARYGTSQQCLHAFMPRPREVGLEFSFKF